MHRTLQMEETPHYRYPAFRAFSSKAYRYFWLATFFSFGTFQMQQVARAFLARDLTPSPLQVTAVFALGTLPMLFAPLLGGSLADRADRKKVMFAAEAAQMAMAALTAALIVADAMTIPILMAVSFVSGVFMGVIFPVRQTMIRELTTPDSSTNGLFLYSSVFSSMQIIAPSISGVMIDFFGVESPFYVGLGMYALVFYYIGRTPVRPPTEAPKQSFVESATVGLRYVAQTPLLRLVMVSSAVGTILLIPVFALLPIFQRDVLEVGPSGLGMLFAAMGVGSLLSSVVLAIFGGERPNIRVALGFGIVAGVVEAVFAQSSVFVLSLVLLLGVGFTQGVFMILSMAMVQVGTPDEMLGRVFAVRMMVLGLIPVGTLIAGAGAEVTSAQTSLAVMGIVASCLMFASLLWLAIPCGALTTIRERPVAKALRMKGVPEAPPLRSRTHLWGLEEMLRNPRFAKRLAEANRFIEAAFALILLADSLGIPWFVENPLNSLLWLFPSWNDIAFLDCDFAACMHGASRLKWQRIRFSKAFAGAADFLKMAVKCDGSHSHKPWGPLFVGDKFAGFATQEEAAYPTEFCRRVAEIIAGSGLTSLVAESDLPELKGLLAALSRPITKDANKLRCASARAHLGQQPRGRTLDQAISEYKEFKWIKFEAARALEWQGSRPTLERDVQGIDGTALAGWRVLETRVVETTVPH